MTAPDTLLKLGDFTFTGFEVPSVMPGGGTQKVIVHELVGGDRVVDSMGRADKPLKWKGRFRGPDAKAHCRRLDAMRVLGKPLALTWDEFNYTVVIESFDWEYMRKYEIEYDISCAVVADNMITNATANQISIDGAVAADMNAAAAQASTLGNSGISGLIGQAQSALGKVNSLVTATRAQIAAIAAPITSAISQVTSLYTSAEQTIQGVNLLTNQISSLGASITTLGNITNARNLGVTLGRLNANLSNLQVAGSSLTMVGGNLYQVASQRYGDPSAWTDIAKSNGGLLDPILNGVNVLHIPSQQSNSGGVSQ